MMSSIGDWFKSFDVAKAVLLAIVAILGSWYDLRGQVDMVKQEANLKWQVQDKLDARQDKAMDDLKVEIKDGIKDLKQTMRDLNQGNARR